MKINKNELKKLDNKNMPDVYFFLDSYIIYKDFSCMKV